MDILRRELEEIYAGQRLQEETLDRWALEGYRRSVGRMADMTRGCCVITDAASDRCYVYGGAFARLMGWEMQANDERCVTHDDLSCWELVLDSSDEDFIYNRIHPESLPEKRLLEFEFFKMIDKLPADQKLHHKAVSRFRIQDKEGNYIWVDNSTQVLCLSPKGMMWLILCIYDLSADQTPHEGIAPRIKDYRTGKVATLSLAERKAHILTRREKEILSLIRQGKSSKMIADELSISRNTINRHRQNILEKLSVSNSFEAITAAESMGLL